MLRSHILHRLVSCTLLLLGSVESRPNLVTQEATPGPRTGNQTGLLLEAVKMGILSSLGMDREPRLSQKATVQELRKMHQLYKEKLREMQGNSSQMLKETWRPRVATLPDTVEQVKVLRRGEHPQSYRHMRWYRVIFHKNPNIQPEKALARAELMISRQRMNKHTSAQPEATQEVNVKVNGRRSTNAAAWTHTDTQVHTNASASHDAMLDMSPEVERWMRTVGGQALVVDIGLVVVDSGRDNHNGKPAISLEIDLVQPKISERIRRSTKEDDCDERGWCCRKSLTVSFKEIGWTDWVVAPTEYTMHFCDGTCPHNYKPASMHTQVKSRLQQINRSATPRPCCVPAAYEPMVLMHYDSRGKLKLTPFDDLIVSRCHCA